MVATPTLGTPVTRTPAPAEECPPGGSQPSELTTARDGTIIEVFEPQLLAYLNAAGSAAGLESALRPLTMLGGTWQARPQVQTIDVTGNSTPDVIIELSFFEPGQFSEHALFIYRCDDAKFVGGSVLWQSGQVLSRTVPDGIRAIRDMNANGVPEIVHSYISIAGSHSYFTREFSVLEWDGQGFVNLIQADEPDQAARAESGDGELRDVDGNGTLELLLSNAVAEAFPDLGPQRPRTDVWEWSGYGFARTRSLYTEPVFRIHAIWDGDDATRFGDYQAALAFYQQAVFDEQLLGWSRGRLWPDSYYGGQPTPTPDPAERPRLSAYGRYRIMLLHAVQGNGDAAEVVYRTLTELFPAPAVGSQYAELARAFWTEYTSSREVSRGCAAVIAAAGPAVIDPLGSAFYGVGQRKYEPADLCPFVP